MSEERDSGSEPPMTRVFRQLADAANAHIGTDRIVDLAGQFDAALGPTDQGDVASDPSEDGEPPQP
jgi:hypothetical protein